MPLPRHPMRALPLRRGLGSKGLTGTIPSQLALLNATLTMSLCAAPAPLSVPACMQSVYV